MNMGVAGFLVVDGKIGSSSIIALNILFSCFYYLCIEKCVIRHSLFHYNRAKTHTTRLL